MSPTHSAPQQPQPSSVLPTAPRPVTVPTLAVRKGCRPDGIGLSHYVLMSPGVAQ